MKKKKYSSSQTVNKIRILKNKNYYCYFSFVLL